MNYLHTDGFMIQTHECIDASETVLRRLDSFHCKPQVMVVPSPN